MSTATSSTGLRRKKIRKEQKWLTDLEVHAIRARPNVTADILAEQFDVSIATISFVRNASGRFLDIVTPGWKCLWPRERDSVMAKVAIIDGHWHWTGSVNQSNVPMWRPKGSRTSQSARKAIYQEHHAWYDDKRWRVVRTCNVPLCVNPDHATLELVRRETEEYTSGGKENE